MTLNILYSIRGIVQIETINWHLENQIFYKSCDRFLVLGLVELDDLDILAGVDVGSAQGGEKHELVLPVLSGVVEDVINGNLETNISSKLSHCNYSIPFG